MSENIEAEIDDDDDDKGGNVREQDRFLPIANISRIMKKALPANAKIAKDAKETVQECVSEFISFITSEASDKCQREKRKTINGDDLLWAMSTLGFEEYVEPLKVYLHKYREVRPCLQTKVFSLSRVADGCAIYRRPKEKRPPPQSKAMASQRKQMWLARGHRLDVEICVQAKPACKPVGIKAECDYYCGISPLSVSCIVL